MQKILLFCLLAITLPAACMYQYNCVSSLEVKIIDSLEPFKEKQHSLMLMRGSLINSWLHEVGYGSKHRSVKAFRNIISNYLKSGKCTYLDPDNEKYKRAKNVESDVEKLSSLIKKGELIIRMTKNVPSVLNEGPQSIKSIKGIHILISMRNLYDKKKPNEEQYWQELNERIKQIEQRSLVHDELLNLFK